MEITKKQLEDIYYNNTIIEACKILNITAPTLLSYVDKHNIERKGKGRGQSLKVIE